MDGEELKMSKRFWVAKSKIEIESESEESNTTSDQQTMVIDKRIERREDAQVYYNPESRNADGLKESSRLDSSRCEGGDVAEDGSGIQAPTICTIRSVLVGVSLA